ncbi:unnamed protein product [Adineta ricciae]|uniref:G-protein coupled receptors family 1 profile domain-containing protein n=1 Tax=Adineta ricciae TaxID=249248 RepID=A0A814XJ91_ADIRI|nr:unnamed protein product [Adineta ricciae]CAF1217512.1 unnamed protein product [Adineta ricciae]
MSNTTIANNSLISTSSSQAQLIEFVNFLNKIISQYGLAVIWLIGNIGSILMCIVFTQPTYRHSPCAIFFLAASISQFFTYNFALLTHMLSNGYGVYASRNSLWYCKLRSYLLYISVSVPRYDIILASMDRYFASSPQATHRQRSSPKIALRLILANVLIWSLLYIQVIVIYDIENGICTYPSNAYGIFFSIYIALDTGVLPLLLMLTFGLLTVRNVHQMKKRIGPGVRPNQTRLSRNDLQLHRMLANQIILFVILNVPNPVYLIYQSITLRLFDSPLRYTSEVFAESMTYVLIYLGFSLTFCNFMISSTIFRREFRRLIRTKILRQPDL